MCNTTHILPYCQDMCNEIINKMNELSISFNSPQFLFKKTPRIPTSVKIKEGVSKEEAEEIKGKLEDAGAAIELKQQYKEYSNYFDFAFAKYPF